MKNNIGAVVVHHKHYDTVGAVVSSLLSEGILAANVVVIDNSEEPEQLDSLRASLVADVTLIAVDNKGYGAAVNLGVQTLAEARRFDYILVATHEVVIERGAVAKLASALDNDLTVGAAGPVLTVEADGKALIWSSGGRFAAVSGVPQHHDHKTGYAEFARRTFPATLDRSWLDGAFVLYRADPLVHHRINELFFMYIEEVELHERLRRDGFRVVVVPEARVEQSSNGTPIYFFSRNLIILHRLLGHRWRIALVPALVCRSTLAEVVRKRSLQPIASALSGALNGLRARI